jgi:hypothetical protein
VTVKHLVKKPVTVLKRAKTVGKLTVGFKQLRVSFY